MSRFLSSRIAPLVWVCIVVCGVDACSNKPADPASPPTLSPIGSKSVTEGQVLQFGVSAQGGGSNWPALSTSTLPAGANFTDHLDGTGTFDWTPTLSQVGNYPVVFRATDLGLADSEVVLIEVTSVPPAPPKDSIIITSDTVFAGDTAEVELVLANPDSAVAGLNIWLKSAPGILYDTALEVIPRFPITSMTWSGQRYDSIQVFSLLMVDFIPPLDFVSPGRGPLFRLRFVVDSTQPPGAYAIDTTSLVVPLSLNMSYRSGLSVPKVGFVAGQIVVQ